MQTRKRKGDLLRDSEIRAALRSKLHSIHFSEPDTSIIDELSLCQGEARVDMAVVNGFLSGYEIKSDRDKLVRLPHQLSVYELCFDTMTAVVGSRHVNECRGILPPCWGIWEAIAEEPNEITIEIRREPSANHGISPNCVVQLLWRQEAFDALQKLGGKPSANATRKELWAALVSEVTSERLFEIVRGQIRARGDWRSGPTPFRGDGLSRSVSMSQHSRENRRWLLSTVSRHHPD